MILCPECEKSVNLKRPEESECQCGSRRTNPNGIFSFAPDYKSYFADHTEESVDLLGRYATSHFWLLERKRWVVRAVNRYLEPKSTFLDIGSGGGDIAVELRRSGIDVSLGDIQIGGLEASARFGFENLFQFDLYRPIFLDHFRGIGAFDVLEHLADDQLAVENLIQMVVPGGYIFVTVPAFQFLWNRRDIMEKHKRRYSRSRLKSLFLQAGVDVVACDYIFSFIFPLLVSRALISRFSSRKEFSTEAQYRQWEINRFLNSSLKAITRVERKIFRSFALPFGGSLLLVARRPFP